LPKLPSPGHCEVNRFAVVVQLLVSPVQLRVVVGDLMVLPSYWRGKVFLRHTCEALSTVHHPLCSVQPVVRSPFPAIVECFHGKPTRIGRVPLIGTLPVSGTIPCQRYCVRLFNTGEFGSAQNVLLRIRTYCATVGWGIRTCWQPRSGTRRGRSSRQRRVAYISTDTCWL